MGSMIEAPVFLEDQPNQGESSFEIHDAIAGELANEITHDSPSNIAIVGDWGSGKSTVLNLIELKLGKAFSFFTFDAWAHSGDALRKNFLYALARKLKEAPNADIETIEKVEKSLSNKTTERTLKEEALFPPLTGALLLAVGAYALAVIIIGLMGFGIDSWRVHQHPPIAPVTPSTFQFLQQLFSLLAGSIVFCIAYRKIKGIKRRSVFKALWKDIKEFPTELMAFCTKKPLSSTTVIQEIHSEILDSVLFQQKYIELIGTTKTPLVIAFDNLDRLSAKELSETWSTLQIFAGLSSDGFGQNKKPWILMPVSREIYSELDKPGGKIGISKLFIRSFEIPTPISSDWKGYFNAQLEIAFPGISLEDRDTVYMVAAHSMLTMEQRSPRNAKRFINTIVAQKKVFPDISLVSAAAFCSLRDYYLVEVSKSSNLEGSDCKRANSTFSNFMLTAIAGSSKHEQYLASYEESCPNLRSELSMMTFGVFSSEKAQEVFVASSVQNAIASNSRLDLSALVKGRNGAWEHINRIVIDELDASILQSSTPDWVFNLLIELSPESEGLARKDDLARRQLAKECVKRIHSFALVSTSYDSISTVTEALEGLSKDTAKSLLDRIVDEYGGLLQLDRSGDEASSNQLQYLNSYSVMLIRVLDSVSVGTHKDLISSTDLLSSLNTEGQLYQIYKAGAFTERSINWLKELRIASESEFYDVLDLFLAHVPLSDPSEVEGSCNHIEFVRDARIFDSYELSNGELNWPELLDSSVEIKAETKVKLWYLVNIHEFASSALKKIFESIYVDIVQLFDTGYEPNSYVKTALIAMILLGDIELNAAEETPVKYVCELMHNDNMIYNNEKLDLVSWAIAYHKGDGSDEVALAVLDCFWNVESNANKTIDDYEYYVGLTRDSKRRKQLGEEVARSQMVDELMQCNFNYAFSSFYLGVLEGAPENKEFKNWAVEGFKALNATHWESIMNHKLNTKAIPLLRAIRPPAQSFPVLQEVLIAAIDNDCVPKYFFELLGMQQIQSDVLNERFSYVFFSKGRTWRSWLRTWNSFLETSQWFKSLCIDDRYKVFEMIIKSDALVHIEWLRDQLKKSDDPKKILRGKLKEARKLLRKKTEQNNSSRKVIFDEILDLLAPGEHSG